MENNLQDFKKQQKRKETLTRLGRILLTGINGGALAAFLFTLPTTGVIELDPLMSYIFPFLIMVLVGVLNRSIPDAVLGAMVAFVSYNLIMFYFLLMPVYLGVYLGDVAIFTLANAATVVQSSIFILTISIFGSFIGALLYEFV